MAGCLTHTLLLDIHGGVWGVGNNQSGPLGVITSEEQQDRFARFPDLPPITSLYSGEDCSYFIDGQGNTFSCGDNSLGRLGFMPNDGKQFYFAPKKVQLRNIKKVAANCPFQTLFLDESGIVWLSGKEGSFSAETHAIPKKCIHALPPVKDIAMASDILLLDENCEVWIRTFSVPNQLLNMNKEYNLPPIASICAGSQAHMLLDVDGYIWIIGDGSSFGINADTITPYKIPELPRFSQLSFNHRHCLALTENQEVFSAGEFVHGELGRKKNGAFTIIENLRPITTVYAGHYSSLFLDNQGTLLVCGSNDRRKLGQRELSFHKIVEVGGLPPILQKNSAPRPSKSARNV